MENRDLAVDDSVSLSGLTSSYIVSMEDFITKMSWRGAQEVGMKRLVEALISFLKGAESVVRVGFNCRWEAKRPRGVFQ